MDIKVDTELDKLCDEQLVLKGVEHWPHSKVDCIREVAGRVVEVR